MRKAFKERGKQREMGIVRRFKKRNRQEAARRGVAKLGDVV